MRQILIAAAALAVGGIFAATAARAEPVYEPGGLVQIGGYCKVVTSDFDNFGYYAPCEFRTMHMTRHSRRK